MKHSSKKVIFSIYLESKVLLNSFRPQAVFVPLFYRYLKVLKVLIRCEIRKYL